jgi:hypothetical protein
MRPSLSRHERAFWEFHSQNPHVYEKLEQLALQLRRSGVSRWGIKALWEVCRYELVLRTGSNARSFRLNNNYTAYYARLLMERNAELTDFFEVRHHRGEHTYAIAP